MSFKRIGGDDARVGVRGNGELGAAKTACGADGGGQLVAVRVGDGRTLGEALFGCLGLAALHDAVVGEQACAFEVIHRPASGPAVAAGEVVGEVFDDAVAGLAGAVVAGQVGVSVKGPCHGTLL